MPEIWNFFKRLSQSLQDAVLMSNVFWGQRYLISVLLNFEINEFQIILSCKNVSGQSFNILKPTSDGAASVNFVLILDVLTFCLGSFNTQKKSLLLQCPRLWMSFMTHLHLIKLMIKNTTLLPFCVAKSFYVV